MLLKFKGLDLLNHILTLITIIFYLQSAAHSFFLHQKLHLINASVDELRPIVDSLQFSVNGLSSHPINEVVYQLQKGAKAVNTEVSIIFLIKNFLLNLKLNFISIFY